MRILWITNGPIAIHRKQLGVSFLQSGGWMDAAYESIKNEPNIELGLATVYNCTSVIYNESDTVKMYAVPNDCKGRIYQYSKTQNIAFWKEIAKDFNPEVIHIWGTEMAHGLCAMNAMPEIPTVVYLQGMMAQIYNHGNAGIGFTEKLHYFTVRSFIEEKGIHSDSPFEKRRAEVEQLLISKAKNVILENDWSEINCKAICPECRVYRSLLPINKKFAEYEWQAENMNPHTIFTVAGGYPIKGHHILLKALSIIKKWFPDVRLYIPGYNPLNDDKGLRRLFPLFYTRYVRHLIKKFNLSENIIYTGKLTFQEMASYMSKCNVFVMPSAVENHSSTLIEAMMVGAPCVSSYVGGVSDYLHHGKNGFIYRFDEPEALAGYVMKLFEDNTLAAFIGKNALNSSREERLSNNIHNDLLNAYSMIRNEYRCKE